MQTYGFALFAMSNPGAPAIVDTRGNVWSRDDVSTAVNQVAHALRAHGLRRRDVLAILAPNCIEFVVLHLAATEIGLYVVPINWHLSPQEIVYILEDSGAVALAAHERLAHLLRQASSQDARSPQVNIAFGRIPGFISLDDLRHDQPTHRVFAPVVGRMMMYTSATTGRPKAIEVPIHNAAFAQSRTIDFHISTGIRLEDGNVHLCASMLYHAAPLEFVVIALHMGHKVVLVERWDPQQLLDLIQEHRVTTTFMVPAMFIRLLKLANDLRARYDVSSLRLVTHSAAPCPVDVKRQLIEWWGPVLWEGYGAAEGQGTAVSSDEWLKRPGTVGRAIPGTRIRILDDAGTELPSGQVGTIYFSRYTGDRFEYRNDPEKTRAAYKGELFTVGDVGYLDDEGYLFICDRKVDMIICGGTNIYPAEVEQVLVQHPRVLDCAVLGVPDSHMGETVRAVVQLQPGIAGDDAMSSDIMVFLLQRLSSIKLPRKIDYVKTLPRDPNGKLFKRILRDQYWAGQSRKI
jgi:long-chain acyl-CoA synthetase